MPGFNELKANIKKDIKELGKDFHIENSSSFEYYMEKCADAGWDMEDEEEKKLAYAIYYIDNAMSANIKIAEIFTDTKLPETGEERYRKQSDVLSDIIIYTDVATESELLDLKNKNNSNALQYILDYNLTISKYIKTIYSKDSQESDLPNNIEDSKDIKPTLKKDTDNIEINNDINELKSDNIEVKNDINELKSDN
ncbi:MAG: hypothetical protein K5656_03455, partial [Lachnospiraceae bacterium]|nr:hypothetical protein [Lachnospiraceae bacterium]